MTHAMSRRRFIGVSAAAAGLAVLPLGHAGTAAPLVTWRGQALGAVCTLQINHPDRARAQALVARVLAEVRRLEHIFSLYDETSALVRLNRTGVLEAPPVELLDILSTARRFSALTDGAFDVTVQPLWLLYAAHFSTAGADPAGPPEGAVKRVLANVGQHRIRFDRDKVVMPRGMKITLNGIAQGFVTDRVVELLRQAGISHSLVDMGETRAIGDHPDGRAWDVAIADPDRPGHRVGIVPLIDRALATSGPYGFRFDGRGGCNHLFDPATGHCAARYRSVSVRARTATEADALSTAFCVMPPEGIRAAAARVGAELVNIVDEAGIVSQFASSQG